MRNPIEMIKEEFCSRYGLQPEDIDVSVTLWNVPSVELADQIIEESELERLHTSKGRNLDEDTDRARYVKSTTFDTSKDPYNLIHGLSAYTKDGVIK